MSQTPALNGPVEPAGRHVSGVNSPGVPQNPLRVLAVDDDPAALALYGDILSHPLNRLRHPGRAESGAIPALPEFDVSLFSEGTDAVDAVRAALAEDRPYAVAFIDVRLASGPDGIWTAAQIRAFDPAVNIVIVTAFSDLSVLEAVRRTPPADKLLYLAKPFEPQEIRQFALALGTKWHSERLLRETHRWLEERVSERTAELARVNEELRRDVAERHRVEQALRESQERLRHQNRTLMNLTRSPNLGGPNLDAALREIAETAGDTLDASRTSIWIFSPDRSKLRCRELYERPGRRHSEDGEVRVRDHAEYCRLLEEERTFCLYPGAAQVRTLFDRNGAAPTMAARLHAPIRLGGTTAGVVCFDDAAADRRWTVDEEGFAGSVADTVALAIDACERRRMDEALRQLKRAVEQSIDGMAVTDLDGTVLFANRAWAEMHGYRTADLVGSHISLFHTGEQLAVEVRPMMQRARELGSVHGEVGHIRQDGSTLPTRMTLTLLKDDTEVPMGYLAIARDITDQKTADERRAQLEEQLRRSQKMEAVGRLAGGVAHDFNNMLMAILGCSEFVLSLLPPDEPIRRDVEEIKKAGDRAAGLTRQLLAFSRRQVLQPRIVDLNAILTDVESMLRRVIGEDIELVTALDPHLGRIKADPGQIEQVIINLAINARDAMPRGGRLTLETCNADLDEDYSRTHVVVKPGPYVMLAVSDTGIGMDEETQAHIFEPFFTTKGQGKGTGLGLATVYGTVKQSDGYIWAYSELDRGTTFKLYFPQVIEDAAVADRKAPSVDCLQGTETILLVEDDEVVRNLVHRGLLTYGYRVIEAPSGPDALRLCRQYEGHIDLMLTDVVMPQMSGRELAEAMLARRPGLRVLYMSGYSTEAVVRHGMLDKSTPFLQKPFTPETLARKLREIFAETGEGGKPRSLHPNPA